MNGELRPGPLLQRAIAMQGGEPFDHGKQPNWRDESPHPLCEVTREQYPEPRTCLAMVDAQHCYLGHPANCRWLIDAMIDTERRALDAALDGEHQPSAWRRNPACVERWPECSDGEYNPACCRFPKPCSCDEPIGDQP